MDAMDTLVLNSAQSKYPIGNDPWIRATEKAVTALSGTPGIRLYIGSDPLPWSFVAFLAGKCGIPALFAVRSSDSAEGRRMYDDALADFGLQERLVAPLFTGWKASPESKESWPHRDRILIARADAVYPVSIRPGGRLDALIDSMAGSRVRDEYRISYTRSRYRIEINVPERRMASLPRGEWLLHWTRTCRGLWPGETQREFWSDVLAEPDRYVRTAADSLARILQERTIRGSGRHLPKGRTAVGFTSLSPSEALKLMRWRRRYAEFSYEPFGIAVRKKAAVQAGCLPVVYGGSAGTDPLFVHAPGPENVWSGECEWRLEGDCGLDMFHDEDVLAIVPDTISAGRIGVSVPGRIRTHILFP